MKDNPKIARETAFNLGHNFGLFLRREFDIKGEDIIALADILNAAIKKELGEQSLISNDRNVTILNNGYCPVMDAAHTLEVDWEWLDTNFAWPWLKGLISVIKPNIEMKTLSARCRGDRVCKHAFIIS